MPDTLATLLYVCQEGGLRRYDLHREQIPEVPLDPRTGQQDMDELVRYMRVATDLERLQTAGILERSEEHTSELQSRGHLVCRLLLEKKKTVRITRYMRERHRVSES